MNQRGWMILRTMINRYDPNEQDALLRFLPSAEKQAVLSQSVHSHDLEPLMYQHQDTLDRMHYSWLIPLLDQFPENLLPMLVSTLSPQQAAGFKSRKLPHLHLAPLVKSFMQTQLYSKLEIDNRLPLNFLPATDLTALAYYDKKELMAINDFLGLYDLSSEVRRIVNKTHLKNIYTCLSPKQFYYLKSLPASKGKTCWTPFRHRSIQTRLFQIEAAHPQTGAYAFRKSPLRRTPRPRLVHRTHSRYRQRQDFIEPV